MKILMKNNYRGRGGSKNNPARKTQVQEKIHQQDINLRIKYNCRLCGLNFKRILHPSCFLLPCGRCNFSSHLNGVKSNKHLVIGKYQCQERRCGNKWMQRLPFRNIVLNTPLCSNCNRRTKVSQVTFKGILVGFKNSLLYKCQSCSKQKSLSLYHATQAGREGLSGGKQEISDTRLPSNPECYTCHTPMTFLRNLRKAFTSPTEDAYPMRHRSFSPKQRHPRTKNYEKRPRMPRSQGDSPKEGQNKTDAQTDYQSNINNQI
jgi:hypothetical protein